MSKNFKILFVLFVLFVSINCASKKNLLTVDPNKYILLDSIKKCGNKVANMNFFKSYEKIIVENLQNNNVSDTLAVYHISDAIISALVRKGNIVIEPNSNINKISNIRNNKLKSNNNFYYKSDSIPDKILAYRITECGVRYMSPDPTDGRVPASNIKREALTIIYVRIIDHKRNNEVIWSGDITSSVVDFVPKYSKKVLERKNYIFYK